jgi:hypothetical protein
MSAIIATANSVAEPRSWRPGFDRGDGFGGNRDPWQQNRSRGDPCDDAPIAAAQLDLSSGWGDRTRRVHGRPIVATGREPGSLPGRVDAPHLHRHGREARQAQHQDHHERRDRKRGLDGGATDVTAQTLVFSARVMMLVNALTIESPVTTV